MVAGPVEATIRVGWSHRLAVPVNAKPLRERMTSTTKDTRTIRIRLPAPSRRRGRIPSNGALLSESRVRDLAVAIAVIVITSGATISCDSRRAVARDAAGDVPTQSNGDVALTVGDGAEATDAFEQSGEVGRTMVGVYTCCAPNEAKACCAGIAQGLCYQYGGVAGR